MNVAVVCHGNIARSQVLHHYLQRYANAKSLDVCIFSCGTAKASAYEDVEALLREVEDRLFARGLDVSVTRNAWCGESMEQIRKADLVLVADAARKAELDERLGELGNERVFLFYEFIGEGAKDFADTYDPARQAQDPHRFDQAFDELQRIARLSVERLENDYGNA